VAKKFMYSQQPDADGPVHPSPVWPTYTTTVTGSQLLVASSTFTKTRSPADGSADSITTGTPTIADTAKASIARMANTVALPLISAPGAGSAPRGTGPFAVI
jgi:hypothetical protein